MRLLDDMQAMWSMRAYVESARQITEAKELARVEHERIDAWVVAVTTPLSQKAAYHERLLSTYAKWQRSEGRLSLSFPTGDVQTRKVGAKAVVEDADAFIAWATENGHEDWIRVKPEVREVNLKGLAGHLDFNGSAAVDPASGIAIPGLSATEESVGVSIKPTEA
jgi:phage host-nuclease inhibitor protein Gam